MNVVDDLRLWLLNWRRRRCPRCYSEYEAHIRATESVGECGNELVYGADEARVRIGIQEGRLSEDGNFKSTKART